MTAHTPARCSFPVRDTRLPLVYRFPFGQRFPSTSARKVKYLAKMNSEPLSRSVEDYLKAVYLLNERGRAAGTSQLADALEVQPASVSGMVRRLAGDGLVRHEPYRGVRLTAKGKREALRILRRHRVIESYLVRRLGFSWDNVHAEAERLEHAASDDLVDRMAEAVDNPATDPHGAPIPTRSGEIDPTRYPCLDEMASGAHIRIRSVSDRDPARLRYFESVRLVPGARAIVRRRRNAPDEVMVVLEQDEKRGTSPPATVIALAASVARRVTVEEIPAPIS